jgi:lipid-A-disaccharide synthase-like uncharacterized protein
MRFSFVPSWAVPAAGVFLGLMAAPAPAGQSCVLASLTGMLRDFEVNKQLRDPWVWFGFGAQGLFAMRFVWQWIVSEKRRRSTIPVAFWYLSLSGGLTLFFYAAHRHDLVIMAGQLLACVIYIRNLMLIHGRAARRRRAGVSVSRLGSVVKGQQEDEVLP